MDRFAKLRAEVAALYATNKTMLVDVDDVMLLLAVYDAAQTFHEAFATQNEDERKDDHS